MLKFFSKSYIVQYISILFLGLILWSPAFTGCVRFPVLNQYNGEFAGLFTFLNEIPNILSVLIAFVLTYFLGMLLNNMAQRFSVIDKNSLYVLLIFVILSSLFTFNMIMAYQIIAGFILFFLILEIFKSEVVSENIILSFNAGFFLGLIGLFYFPASILILFIWFSLNIVGGISWRNIAASFIGVLIVIFGDYLYFFFTSNEEVFFQNLSRAFTVSFDWLNNLNNNISLFYLIMLAVFFIAAIFAINNPVKLAIRQRKILSIMGLLTIFLVVLLLLFNTKPMVYPVFLPVAIIFGSVLEKISKTKRINIMFLITLILILVNNWLSCL